MTSRSAFLRSAALGVAAASVPRIASAQLVPVRVGAILSDVFGSPFYASAAGAFAKAGFDIQVSGIRNPNYAISAFGRGDAEYEFIAVDILTGTLAMAAKIPLLLVAGLGLYRSTDPTNTLAVAKNSPLRSPKDLIGKTIGLGSLSGIGYTCLRAWLEQNGIALDQVKIIELLTPAMGPALVRGTVDASLIAEPFWSYFRDDIRDFAHFYDVCAKQYIQTAWYASKAWFEADRDRARKVVAAIYETQRWANAHHDETLALLVREAKFDPDKVQGMRRQWFTTSLTPPLVQPVLDLGAKYKALDQRFDAKQLITTA